MVLIFFGLLKLNPKPFELRGQGLPAKTENLVILMPTVGLTVCLVTFRKGKPAERGLVVPLLVLLGNVPLTVSP